MRSGTDGYAHRMSTGLPNLVVIGAIKCATTALHRYLDAHPDVSMSAAKETNFFTGPDERPNDDPTTWWRFGHRHVGAAVQEAVADDTERLRNYLGDPLPEWRVQCERGALGHVR
jgi:hypothetical protein